MEYGKNKTNWVAKMMTLFSFILLMGGAFAQGDAIAFTSFESIPEENLNKAKDVTDCAGRAMYQSALHNRTFHLSIAPTDRINPAIRVYNQAGKLVLFQNWTGDYGTKDMHVIMPETIPSGTYKAMITANNKRWTQNVQW